MTRIAPVPTVSVILPFLDEERFLEEAVRSVTEQTHADWELLLVDDGSGDRSRDIARALATKFPERIRCLEHEGRANRGLSASRNLGVAHARGRYVAFIDADDVWVPEKLGEQVAILEANPMASMVVGATRYWHGWTGDPADACRDEVVVLDGPKDVLVRPPFLLFVAPFGPGITPSMSNFLARRELFDAIGGFEESFTGMREDMVFFVKVFHQEYVYSSSRCWDWYRQRATSISNAPTTRGARRAATSEFHRWVIRYFTQEHPTLDPYLLERLRDMKLRLEHPLLYRIRPRYFLDLFRPRLRRWLRRRLPLSAKEWIGAALKKLRAPALWFTKVLRVRYLGRLTPTHPEFGCYHGTPVDRYYIEGFLSRRAGDIRGRVLEVGGDTYTRKFGGERVTQSDVFHAMQGNPRATIVGDLADAPHVADDTFDCIILTQTLQCIYDFRGALRTLYRVLKPGGVLLVTIPGVAHQISREERPYWGDYWRWTSMAAERMFAEAFPARAVEIETRGNVLIAMAFLDGLVVEELRPRDFEYFDPEYEVSILVRAEKPNA